MARDDDDDDATWQLVERYRNELRLHAYRMLGSSHDVDDVLQEVAVRAWRARATLEDPARARAWLYRIASNVCLDALRERKARRRPFELGAPGTGDPLAAPTDRDAFVEPAPDRWLDGVAADPSAAYELRESVTLAFVAALQHLTPPQRATLLLREVVGLSADETARALDLSVDAVTSALARARSTAATRLAARRSDGDALDEATLARYARAWREGDVEAFVAMLHDEVKTTMPPAALWIDGRDANRGFYAPMFHRFAPSQLDVLPTRANGCPALGFYRADSASAPRRFRAIHTVAVREGRVALIEHFMLPELARLFGLPDEI